uniref:Subtilisin-like protease n=1 Tax=Leersia perrieri TaxID=77586 RepID=A0A0D9X325_9ORYZ
MASLLPLIPLLIAFIISPNPALCYINPSAKTLNNNAPNSSGRRTYIVFVEPPPVSHVDGDRRRWHESFLPATHLADESPRLVHSYGEVFSGFAARLTAGELDAVSNTPGFVHAFPDTMLHLMTTHSPEFLGLTRNAGAAADVWRDTGYGKGVIVGVLDTGIHAPHPSFDDHGVSPPPARWKGSCAGHGVRCNNKLIGAKSFAGADNDTSDAAGHGTHTSSTAAGNFVDGASVNGGVGNGTTAGIAPGAHLAMYKVCGGDGQCTGSALLAGIEEAITDGVDILSISLGSTIPLKFEEDPLAIGAFTAVAKGITVVVAAGNSGPFVGSVFNEAPWLFTVAAGSIDRQFSAVTKLGNGKVVNGETLYQSKKSTISRKSYPLFYSDGTRLCKFIERTRDVVGGKIVLCELDSSSSLFKQLIDQFKEAGVAGVVVINSEVDGYATVLSDLGSDVVQVTAADGNATAAYVAAAKGKKAAAASVAFKDTVVGVRPAPTVASFSSRGPSVHNPGVLKPDILAPGLNILAAWPPHLATGGDAGVNAARAATFSVESGTSMATPHVSGVAALVKSAHPGWSPAAIKSAIMTSSDDVDNTGGPILDEHHAVAGAYLAGAGHVNPARAVDPGLVYNIAVDDYAGYICTLAGENALKIIAQNSSLRCKNLPKISQTQLNYPAITLSVESSTASRTVTNVGPANSTYTANLTMMIGNSSSSVRVSVSPEKLVFGKAEEKKTFTVRVTARGRESGKRVVEEGSLSWVSEKHVVRSPVLVVSGGGGGASAPPPPATATAQLRDFHGLF